MNRGFQTMLPQTEKEVNKRHYNFRQSIRFTLFKREFHIYFSVKPNPE